MGSMALYTKQDLKDSQELYHDCEFISKKTRSIYSWRAALWVRYCKERKQDFAVTEERLIEYLDWLFEIDLVNKINTKKSYVPDILRDHLGSVVCLWRIQTGNNPDLVSPKEGTRFQAKWDEILRSYPRRHERFQSRSYLLDGRGTDSGVGTPGMGPAMSPHMTSVPQHADTSDYKYQQHGNYQYDQRYSGHDSSQQRAQLPPLAQMPPPPTQQQQHQQQSPSPSYLALDERREMDWQLQWLHSGTWSALTARALFTVAISAWVDVVEVMSMRLADVSFRSSTMAPRLPSSVLRVSLLAKTPSAQTPMGGQHPSNKPVGARHHFSIIRARNPLICAWNSLATLMFHRWHLAGSPPPTFADSMWHGTLVIIPRSRTPSPSSDRRNSVLSDVTMEPTVAGFATIGERLDFVHNLLPGERLPMERVVRQHSLQCARESSAGPSFMQHSETRHGRPRSGHGAGDAFLAPLAESEAPDRLYALSTANSGYNEPHHTIQRHKVIPPESLQQTIFPWVSAMLSTVPVNAGVDERRGISRFLDFLHDLRIVLLQDMAVLKCCAAQLPRGMEMSSILGNPIFCTPEFNSFCATMRANAADELRVFQHDLEATINATAPRHTEHYGKQQMEGGMVLPSISKLQVHDEAMGSPHGSFSLTASPSPPVNLRDMARNSMPYTDSPRMSDIGHVQGSLRAPTGRRDDTSVSHSMPSRVMEHWGNNGNGSMMPKRRRDFGGGPVVLTSPSIAAANPNSPRGGFSSPPGQAATLHPSGHPSHHHPYHPSQRAPRSPHIGGSAARPNLSGNPLPPISQFVQPGSTPMLSPPATSGYPTTHGIQQQDPSPNSRYADGPAAANDGMPYVDTNQICYLREENAQLRSRLQRLEQSVMQKQAEMQDWMQRVEQYIMRPNDSRII